MSTEPTDVEEVAQSLWRVPLRTPTLPPATRINTFVLARRDVWVIDPGSPRVRELQRLIALMHDRFGHRRLAGFVITHHHRDHWRGLPRLLRTFPAPVVAHDHTLFGSLDAAFRPPGWFEDQVGGGVRLLHTPGHASDHLVLVTEAADVIAGDLVAGVGTVVINPPDGRMADYLDSLRRLLTLSPRRMFPAHGPTIEDGQAKLEEYLAHRSMRESQVLEALAALGPTTPARMVPRIYDDVPLRMRPVAARSVLAHLLKLESEGRAKRHGRKWKSEVRNQKSEGGSF